MMYEFRCLQGHVTEDLFHHTRRPQSIKCEVCGTDARHILSLVAKTPGRWGDGRGYYDSALGTYINNAQHKDKVMADKGLVHESDMSSGFCDSKVQDSINDKKSHDLDMSRYRSSMDDHGDTGRALAETFPSEDTV